MMGEHRTSDSQNGDGTFAASATTSIASGAGAALMGSAIAGGITGTVIAGIVGLALGAGASIAAAYLTQRGKTLKTVGNEHPDVPSEPFSSGDAS